MYHSIGVMCILEAQMYYDESCIHMAIKTNCKAPKGSVSCTCIQYKTLLEIQCVKSCLILVFGAEWNHDLVSTNYL